jgi:CopG family transcriptional regulator, nickel-responsive regulator
MQRVTITLDDDLMADLDRIIAARGYQNRSEAIRDLARSGLQQAAVEAAGSRNCVAALVYVYDHHARDLPKRLTQGFHDHHDLSQATLHVHLDHESCLEVTVLKGRGSEVQSFANHVIAERGVRHGHVVYMPAPDGAAHRHAHDHDHGKEHSHAPGHNHSPKRPSTSPSKRRGRRNV